MSYFNTKVKDGPQIEKVSYVTEFKPWKWAIGTGLYLDDLHDAFDKAIGLYAAVAAVILLCLCARSAGARH